MNVNTNKITFADDIIKQIFEKLPTPDQQNRTYKRHIRKLKSRISKSVKSQVEDLTELNESASSIITDKFIDRFCKQASDLIHETTSSDSSPSSNQNTSENTPSRESARDETESLKTLAAANKEQFDDSSKHSRLKSTLWDVNNRFLTYRSRELSKVKLNGVFKSRTEMMVDAANFSDFLGNVDRVLLECPVETFNFPDEQISSNYNLQDTQKHRLTKVYFKNGEICVLKRVLMKSEGSEIKRLTSISREMKILYLVDHHPNIVQAHGVTLFQDSPALVMSYESDINLKNLFQKFKTVQFFLLKKIIIGIIDALSHLMEKEIIHNMILPENVCLKYNGKYYDPVIVGFSYALRQACSRTLTIPQQKLFEEFLHVPIRVKKGKECPSFSSDMYAFTCILRRLRVYLPDNQQQYLTETMIETLASVQFSPELLKEYVSNSLSY